VDEGEKRRRARLHLPAEAVESHRAGGARLLWLAHPAQVDHLRKKFPLGMMAKVELPRLGTGGTSLEDFILLAAEGAAGGPFPKSPDEFRILTEKRARAHWFEAAAAIGKASMNRWKSCRNPPWIAANRKDRNLGEIAEDLDEQLAGCSGRDSPGARDFPACGITRAGCVPSVRAWASGLAADRQGP
jgi:ATP-dependent helicase HrpA